MADIGNEEDTVPLSVLHFALSAGLLSGAALLLVGLIHLAVPTYGTAFLALLSSVSPGFHASQTAGSVVIGALYGFFGGSIAAGLLAWMYNWFVGYR